MKPIALPTFLLLLLAAAVVAAAPVLPKEPPPLPEKPALLFLEGRYAERFQLDKVAQLLGATLRTVDLTGREAPPTPADLPTTAEELFQYNLVIIGNLSYATLGPDFTALLKYYVEHGGGLLVLGGDSAFGNGGYAGTPLEALLPVKCAAGPDLKKAGEDAVLRVTGKDGEVLYDVGGGNVVAAYLHAVVELGAGDELSVQAGGAPFMMGWARGQGAVGVVLGAPLGQAKPKVAFWESEAWVGLLAARMAHLSPVLMTAFLGAAGPPGPVGPNAEASARNSLIKLSTTKGDILVETFDKEAPITAGNFLHLVKKGFYDGIVLHRVVPGFVVQGGDPTGTGTGGPGWAIPLEVKPTLKHERGYLSMARTPDPDSAGSQFFICLETEAVAGLDMQYAVFGKVVFGMDVVDELVVGDKLLKVTLEKAGPDAEAAEKASLAVRIDR